jgi:putative tricarboxylic transport membrane protein
VGQAIGRLLPNKDDFKQSYKPVLRGTVIGAILGILPGNGAVLGPFASYTLEKKIAKDPSRFGRGAIEGVAGPESANNAGAQTSFIPLLTLGIPPNAVMALMVGAMTIHGIIPGPQVMTKNPNLFWGMIASMWIGNLMLLVINLPMIGLWVRLLKVPYRLLFPSIVVFCCIGIYRAVRLDWLRLDQARLRTRPAAPRLRARQADGRKLEAIAPHVTRVIRHIHHQSGQRRSVARRSGASYLRSPSVNPQRTRRGIR